MPKSRAVKHDSYLESYQKTKEAKLIGKGGSVIVRNKNGQEFPIYLAIAQFEN
ncbi:hypothetical protein [Colwellia sp. 12G3]|uniref:hypothetical protein n=1 Tax=Colwellia sp. 12G3 TaxID=2058299 RepID=UPI0012FEB753|nr:hypothetical protein [Colwellia sp. 12G3]